MGNVCSPSFSCDETISRGLDCIVKKTKYISELQDNLVALEKQMQKLIEARNDVEGRVRIAEQQQKKRLYQVQGWFSSVQDLENEVEELMRERQQEVEKLCLGGFCSKNCKSSYKFGKKVIETLQTVEKLKAEGDFKEVAQTVLEDPVDERPIAATVVGLQSTLNKVWRCLTEEEVGIIGLYGMGGVGKTTLLTQINNEFCHRQNNFDVIIWSVVSKDLQVQKIQENIATRIGLFNESWESKNPQRKASEIFRVLSRKKFVVLLDDIWKQLDLTEVGLPLPSRENASKIVFTTREYEVCGQMEAHKSFKVECLREEDAYRLFEQKVGRDTLDSHPNIPELAATVAKECAGLPLALITIGRAMACKRTPQVWEHAIEVLRISASKFSGLEERVYSCLKLSYNFLPSDAARSCLLYCSLYPEDFSIHIEDLIDCWICEGFLDEYEGIKVRNHGYDIIYTLVHACLLEEEANNCIKMHDVIRDMALWIANTVDRKQEEFLVRAGVGLTEAPSIRKWKGITRISLSQNKIPSLLGSPSCPHLQTLFLDSNNLDSIDRDFFQSMPSLRVLNLSHNLGLRHIPLGISGLLSLQHLDLSHTAVERLPIEMKQLVDLKCLKLESTHDLRTIPQQLISNLKMLRVLSMFLCGARDQEEDSVLFGDSEVLVEELLCLSHLNVLGITLKSFNALQRFLSFATLQSSTRSLCLKYLNNSKSFSLSSLASLRDLETLHLLVCKHLEELEVVIDHTVEAMTIRETDCFQKLHKVDVRSCSKLRHMTWLIFAPNLKHLWIYNCPNMEEIISVRKLDEIPAEVVRNLVPFAKLQSVRLEVLQNLESIYSKALSFPNLKEITVQGCPWLKKLPLDCSSTTGRTIIISGEERWWEDLEWEDQATQNAFLPCFKVIHVL